MKKHSVCSGIQNHNHNINSSLKDCFLIKRILTFFQINQIMNFSINLLEANTLDVGHIKSLKKEVFQSIDEHQTLLEALFNKNCLLLLTSQQSDSPKYSYEVNKQFSQLLNRYQGCLGYNINLGKLAISILQAFQETLSNQEDSQKLMLQNFQKSQAKLYEETQYLFRQKKIIQEENIRLSLEVQGLNNLLGEQDEKIKQLSQHLQMQKKLAVQLAKSVQAKIGYIEQEHKKFIEKRIQHQISQLKQGINRLTYLYQQKKKEFQNIKMEKEQLQLELITLKSVKQPQNQLYVRERKEIYPLSEITPIICNETIQSSSLLSRQLRNSYNLQKQDHYQIANLKKEMRVLCSPQLLKDCDDDKQNIESLNKTFNNNLYTHKSKNKNRNNTKKIDYAYNNIGVNTQNILMHTKITQISGISKISQFKYPVKTQVHIQTLKQTQFRLPETLIKNDLKKEQGTEQQKNIVKSLIRYMSDKVIYGRIKRKN